MLTSSHARVLQAALGLLCAVLFAPPCFAAVSLDDILTCLESGGIVTNREQALRGGLTGILKSVDAGARLVPAAATTGATEAAKAIHIVELWPEDIAYLKLDALTAGCGPEVTTHLLALKDKAGIVLDLRGAGGDGLDAVSCLAGIGHQSGDPLLIVTDNRGQVLSTNTVTRELVLGVPVMVLIDGGTCGAAEALAAAWRGCAGVMLIGSATRGEACLRSQIILPDGQKAMIASKRLIPIHGEPYAGKGVYPTVEVAAGQDPQPEAAARPATSHQTARPLSRKSEQDRDLMLRVAGDVVLRRATDILLGLRVVNGYGRQ